MAEKAPNLYDAYLIDGIPQALTPAGLLQECTLPGALPAPTPADNVADETVDIAPTPFDFRDEDIDEYADAVAALPRQPFPVPFAGPITRSRIAKALLDAVWMGGHFRLGDLTLKADWRWNDGAIGNQAAFYASVEAAAEYIDHLGLRLSEVKVSGGACNVSFKATTTPEEEAPDEEESLIHELPFRTANPRISRRRRCPATIQPEASDWLIYVSPKPPTGSSTFPWTPATTASAGPCWPPPRAKSAARPLTWATRTISSTHTKSPGNWWRTASSAPAPRCSKAA